MQKIREEIKAKIKTIHPSDAIALLESISKELRRANSIRISRNIPVDLIEMDRPDMLHIK